MNDCPIIKGIGKGPSAATKLDKFLYGPVVDKFFLLGYIGGVLGSVTFGLYLWAVYTGLLSATTNFQTIRNQHLYTQLYLFLTPFICGFFIQAGPKLFEVSNLGAKQVNIILILPFILLPIFFFSQQFFVANLIAAVGLLTVMIRLLTYFSKATFSGILRSGMLAIVSIAGLTLGLFLPIQNPATSLFVVWTGVLAAVFSADQQFIFGVLGGKRISNYWAAVINILVLVVAILLAIGMRSQADQYFQLAAIVILLLWIVHAYSTGLYLTSKQVNNTLGFVIISGQIWLLVGAISLYFNPSASSIVIHIWMLGLVIPILIAVSTRVVQFVGPNEIKFQRNLYYMLIIWQIAVIMRAFPILVYYNTIKTVLVVVPVILLFYYWGRQLIPAAYLMIRRPYL